MLELEVNPGGSAEEEDDDNGVKSSLVGSPRAWKRARAPSTRDAAMRAESTERLDMDLLAGPDGATVATLIGWNTVGAMDGTKMSRERQP